MAQLPANPRCFVGATTRPSRAATPPRRRDDRGIATLELTVVASVLLVMIFTAVSYGIYFYAQNIALGAARAGAQAGAAQGAGPGHGQSRAVDYLHSVGGTLIEHPNVRVVSDGRRVTVSVDGDTQTPIGMHLHVHGLAVRSVERFRPDSTP
jgi:hypothetical protein